MGYDKDKFVVNVDDYICSICLGVLENPIQTHCQHTFCTSCITTWISVGGHHSCPIDKKVLHIVDLKPVPIMVKNLLNHLEVKCEYNGCKEVTQLDQMDRHREVCRYNPSTELECEEGCGLRLVGVQKINHNCINFLKNLLVSERALFHAKVEEVAKEKAQMAQHISQLQAMIAGMRSELDKMGYEENLKQIVVCPSDSTLDEYMRKVKKAKRSGSAESSLDWTKLAHMPDPN